MRAIIIEEDRFSDLLDALRLREMEMRTSPAAETLGISAQAWNAALSEARKQFHYEFVRWAQSHGASCVKK